MSIGAAILIVGLIPSLIRISAEPSTLSMSCWPYIGSCSMVPVALTRRILVIAALCFAALCNLSNQGVLCLRAAETPQHRHRDCVTFLGQINLLLVRIRLFVDPQ